MRKLNVLRRQKGSVLLVVLLVIAVFSIMGLLLINVPFSHMRQISKETSRTQATNAAEMGLKDYNQKIDAALQTINQQAPASFDQFQSELNNALPNTLNQELSTLQGDPNYQVSVQKQTLPGNKIAWTLTSTGAAGGEERIISQNKTFAFNVQYPSTPVYNGLSLPYMDGSAIVKPGNWNCKSHNNNNVYITGSTQNCTGETEQDVDLSGIRTAFQNMTMAAPSADSIPVDSKGNLSVSGGINGDRYISQGSITIPDGTTFYGNVYFGGNVTIAGNVDFKGNVYINGSLAVNGNVTIEGNSYIGSDLDFNGGDTYEGYVFVGGDLVRGSDNVVKGSTVDFSRTVYINSSLDTKSNKAKIMFEQGVVVQGEANPSTSANGLITIGPQLRGTDGSSAPVPATVTTSNTSYQ